jgi:hypothetical protein
LHSTHPLLFISIYTISIQHRLSPSSPSHFTLIFAISPIPHPHLRIFIGFSSYLPGKQVSRWYTRIPESVPLRGRMAHPLVEFVRLCQMGCTVHHSHLHLPTD